MKYLSYLFISLGIVLLSCNDPLEIGNVLLEDEQVDVSVDSLSLRATTVVPDSVLTFRNLEANNFSYNTYSIGQLDDPDFGQTSATAFFNVTLIQALPDLDLYTIDSVVMALRLDTIGRYGDATEVHDLELYELANTFEVADDASLYSFEEIAYDPTPILTQSLVPNYSDTVFVNSYVVDTIESGLLPQLRFRMNTQKWVDLLTSQDSITADVLEELVPGYALRSNASNSMLGLNLQYQAAESSIALYMRTPDDSRRLFIMPIGRLRHNYVSHDFNNGAIASAIDQDNTDFVYAGSKGATGIELDLAPIFTKSDVVINSATLRMSAVDQDSVAYPFPPSIVARFTNDEGIERNVANRFGNPVGGSLTLDEDGNKYYDIDLSYHVNNIIDGNIETTKVAVYNLEREQRPHRAIFYGSNHPDYPIRLKVVTTNP